MHLAPQPLRRTITNSVSSSSTNTVSTTASSSSSSATTASGTNSTSAASSVQIRTSSPISSSDSELSGPANHLISPSKFMNAAVHRQSRTAIVKPNVNNHQLLQQQQQQHHQPQQVKIPSMSNYASMRQLAYEKLRRQQAAQTQPFLNQDIDPQAKLKSMGKLKVATYNNLTHLTVHVVHGRSYKLVDSNEATYVKVNILPDEELCFTNIKTKSVKPSAADGQTSKPQYVYDSKFSFEIDQLTQGNNRLLLSVWSAKLDKLIGCFSFKIKHLLQQQQQQARQYSQKPKQTWFHLLPIKYGVSKHLKVQVAKTAKVGSNAGSKQRQQPHHHADTDAPLTHVNKDLIGMSKMQLVLEKSECESYGFTITSSCPCMIGKVDLDKAAFRHGLRPGDFISKINGSNVSRATVESVVKAVKNSRVKLYIEVYRQDSNLIENIYRSKTQLVNQHSAKSTAQPIYQKIQQDVQQQQPGGELRHVSSKPCFGLEAVPEEEEVEEDEDEVDESQDDYADFDDEYDEDEEVEQRLAVGETVKDVDGVVVADELNFFNAHNSIRFVDSLSSSELVVDADEDEVAQTQDQLERVREQVAVEDGEAEELRRVAAQFYLANNSLNSSNRACKQASIRYLNGARSSINNLSYQLAQKITLSDFDQFI
jgi:hypothetical protein